MRIAVLNGPNLNLLGTREPELYGRQTLADLEAMVRAEADRLGVASLAWTQTNHEGAFVDAVQGLRGSADGALVNAGAFTHTSLAIRDAFLAVQIPFVEVHLSNIFAREPERRHSRLADLAIGVIAGFGPRGYLLGLQALVARLRGS
jgi:3-dehydroquinate dehydratase-2